MEELLKQWDCGELIQIFKDNEINIDNLYDLTKETIKELIPSVGKRLKFSKHFFSALNEAFTSSASTDSFVPCNSPLSSPSTDAASLIPGNDDVELNKMESATDSFILLQSIFPNFDLAALLSTSPLGNSILNFYKENGMLDYTRRNRLTSIIIQHIFNYIVKNRLNHEEYNIITAKIVSLFPSECAATYYVPAIKKINSHTGRPILARGKLVDKCRNLIHKCFGEISKKRRRSTTTDSDNKKSTTELVVVDESIKNDLIWLRHKVEPWTEVIQKWNNTYEVRRNSKATTLDEFLTAWPILKLQQAVTLISLDFERLHKDSSLKLILNWKAFFENILKKKRIGLQDSYALDLLTQIDDETLTEDAKFVLQLICLAYLVPPKGRIALKSGHWKYSTKEAADSIVCHVKIPGDILPLIEQQKEKAFSKKQQVQPYIIVVGPSLDKICESYVVIDQIRYTFGSVVSAFQCCFELYHVLNAKYPLPAEHLYYLIQLNVYNIHTETDHVIPYIADLISSVQNN